jgi:hypothetical protein
VGCREYTRLSSSTGAMSVRRDGKNSVLCHTCGEFFTAGHMPGCPNSASGQPETWVNAAEVVLLATNTPMRLDDLIKEIVYRKLRFVHAGVDPRESLRKAISRACCTRRTRILKCGRGLYTHA